jgi:class 3 adenylate cyclase
VDTETWERAGLYDPADPGADERRALLEFLTARGATLEQLVEAHRQKRLPAVAGDLVLGEHGATTAVEEVAARCGVSSERVARVLLAAGLPPDTQGRVPAEAEALVAGFEGGAELMGEESLLAFTRVLGASATNVAEAAVALFYAELGPGSGRQGADELARAQVGETAMLAFIAVPDILARVLVAHFDRASRRAGQTRDWAAEEADASSEVAALGFVDLVGSTAWAERLSLRDHSLALSRFESVAWAAAVLSEGRVVKTIGDEAFFTAPSVDAACRIGLEVCRVVAEDPLLPPARAAVGHGMVTPREGDYFGPLVNVVSRLVKVAAPGTLVVTEDAAAVLGTDDWSVDELEPQVLRGLDHVVRTFAVSLPAPAPARPTPTPGGLSGR